MSNSLDPDQDRHFVGPDLDLNSLQMLSADDIVGPDLDLNSLQMLSADDKCCRWQGKS